MQLISEPAYGKPLRMSAAANVENGVENNVYMFNIIITLAILYA